MNDWMDGCFGGWMDGNMNDGLIDEIIGRLMLNSWMLDGVGMESWMR